MQTGSPWESGVRDLAAGASSSHTWLTDHIDQLLVALGVGAGATTIAAVAAGFLMVGTIYTFRRILLLVGLFAVVVITVFALGVKVTG